MTDLATNPDGTADRRPHRSRNPGSSRKPSEDTSRGRTTKDPSRTPSQVPSTAIRSRGPNPNLPSPNRLPNHSHLDPNHSHLDPNHGRLPNHSHLDRSLA